MTNDLSKCPVHGQALFATGGGELIGFKSITGILPKEIEKYRYKLLEFQTWVLGFLSQPHPELGRNGHVCPFTEESVESNQFWINVQPAREPSFEETKETVFKFKEIFIRLNSIDTGKKIFITIVILFPNFLLPYYDMIDIVQKDLKPSFVKEGYMLGQFFPGCDQPGLRNNAFRPLDSPLPFLVIRNMGKTDLPFLEGTPEFEEAYFKLFPVKK